MKKWYIVQVLTGVEDQVVSDIKARINEQGLQDLFGRILVPEGGFAKGVGSEDDQKEKIFPGYILVEMELSGESKSLVSSTDRVYKFLGGTDPEPVSEKEVERIFSQISGKIKVKADGTHFVVGGEVHITAGPFEGFVGIVDDVDQEQEKLKVMVSIFGRMTAIELGFDQVKR